jgi:hypothetical protein
MKYALIKDNKVELISYEATEGFVEVADTVFADMIKKSDGSYNYSDEFLAEQEQYKINKKQEEANKQSALNKLKALGLNDAEIKSIIG